MRFTIRTFALLLMVGALAGAADLAGRWKFFIELDPVGWGEPTFTFEQYGCVLTGRYEGPLGRQAVTGRVRGDTAEFAFFFDRGGKPVRALYTGTMDGPDRMTGKLRFDGFFGTGTWTAKRVP